jgi:polyhydroxyalkanoate synthase
MDHIRCALSAALDLLGAGPVETPYRVILRKAGVTLRSYNAGSETGPIVLLIPAPIKHAYIWDLAPSVSVVKRCMQGGVRVFLVQWEKTETEKEKPGLADYADRFILECLEAIALETEARRVFLAGHSLGGALAAIFASLHPESVQGLILLGSPLNFGKDAGDFAPLIMGPFPAQLPTALWTDVPGSFLSTVSSLVSPMSFVWARWIDWLKSLPDAEARETHLRVNRWSLDEAPLSGKLFQEMIELLYRENRFITGMLEIRGQRAAPERIQAPILSVVDARCRVAPPESILPFHDVVRSVERRVLFYGGDTGVAIQHVGMLVGRRAHQHLWPEVLKWIHEHEKNG